jgi:transposase
MKLLIKSAKGTMVFLVVNNLKVHHGKLVSLWLKEHLSYEIQLFYLPPYCPDLNPNEYLKNLMQQKYHF